MNYLIIILFFVSILSANEDEGFGTIQGYIFNGIYYCPIEFTNIELQQANRVTQSMQGGFFRFDGITPGIYALKLSWDYMPDTTIKYIQVKRDSSIDLYILVNRLDCHYDKSKNDKTCPICKKKDQSIPVVFGRSLSPEDSKAEKEGKLYSAGCIKPDCFPNWFCKRDSVKF